MIEDYRNSTLQFAPPSANPAMQPMPGVRVGPPPLPPAYQPRQHHAPIPPIPLPVPPAAPTAPVDQSSAGLAQHFAVFSIAAALFVAAAALVFGLPADHQAMPPGFATMLLLVLLAGATLGIFGIAWSGADRKAVLVAGIVGLCLNALFLLMVCGSMKAAADHRSHPRSAMGIFHSHAG